MPLLVIPQEVRLGWGSVSAPAYEHVAREIDNDRHGVYVAHIRSHTVADRHSRWPCAPRMAWKWRHDEQQARIGRSHEHIRTQDLDWYVPPRRL